MGERPVGARTCGRCGARWTQRRARWCGHCGASLTPTYRRLPAGPWPLRTAAACALAIVAPLAAVAGPAPVPDARAPVEVSTATAPSQDLGGPVRPPLRCHTDASCLEFPTASPHRGPFLGAATRDLLVLVEGAGITGYSLATGARRWHTDLGIDQRHPVPRVVPVEGDGAVVVAVSTGELVAIDDDTGEPRWQRTAPGVEEVLGARVVAAAWHTTVRTRQDNDSSRQVIALPRNGAADRAHTGTGVDATPPPVSDAVATGPPAPERCCDGIVVAAAHDGLDVRPPERVPGGRMRIRDTRTGAHLADLTLATYHGQGLGDGRWLFVAPYRAMVVGAGDRPAP